MKSSWIWKYFLTRAVLDDVSTGIQTSLFQVPREINNTFIWNSILCCEYIVSIISVPAVAVELILFLLKFKAKKWIQVLYISTLGGPWKLCFWITSWFSEKHTNRINTRLLEGLGKGTFPYIEYHSQSY